MPSSALPTEVELAIELMPCQALRVAQEPGAKRHACSYFRNWGTYHSFDYREPGAPSPEDRSNATYLGRAPLAPEMLSGCRKAPILAVGINPNLPGWWVDRHNSLNPWFDDVRQYAHFFRYRGVGKPELPDEDYRAFGGGPHDEPPTSTLQLNVPSDAHGVRAIDVQWRPQRMYAAYQALLDGLAEGMNWPPGVLTVGEDLSYGNMVACPSAKWTTRPDADDPRLPPMSAQERDGIVGECFLKRRYFLRQLFQSLPTVILVFSQSTARAFIGELQGSFSSGDPGPSDSIAELMTKRVTLDFGDRPSGGRIDARVLFGPHPTGDPQDWARARATVVEQLVQAANEGRLTFNEATAHLRRPAGACTFCTTLEIGPCDYVEEIRALAPATPVGVPGALPGAEDKRVQEAMLSQLLAKPSKPKASWDETDEPPEGSRRD